MKTEVCYLTNVRCLNQLLIEQNSSSNMLLLLRVSIAHLYAREETVTEFEKLEQLRCTHAMVRIVQVGSVLCLEVQVWPALLCLEIVLYILQSEIQLLFTLWNL